VVGPARKAAEAAEQNPGLGSNGACFGAAIQLKDGAIIAGSNSPRMHGVSSVITRALKHLAGIPAKIHLPDTTPSTWAMPF